MKTATVLFPGVSPLHFILCLKHFHGLNEGKKFKPISEMLTNIHNVQENSTFIVLVFLFYLRTE